MSQGLFLTHLPLAVHHDTKIFFCKAARLCICLCWPSGGFPESLSPVCWDPCEWLSYHHCVNHYPQFVIIHELYGSALCFTIYIVMRTYIIIGLFVPLTTNLWAYQPSHFFTHLFSLYFSSLATRMFWEVMSKTSAGKGKHPEFYFHDENFSKITASPWTFACLAGIAQETKSMRPDEMHLRIHLRNAANSITKSLFERLWWLRWS